MIFEAPVDREALTKIVSNMLANAVKYASQVIKIELGIAGNNFYLIISNDGVLIDRNDRNKIFNMFYRTEQAEKKVGSGIGLAFCRSLAEMHNGSLELIDRNDYTSFKLTLPLKQQVVFSIESVIDDTDVAELPVPDSPEVSGETILVVEDEPELRNFLKDSLSDLYNVRVASNGLKAMEIIEKTPVSIVITDVMMPKMDGFALTQAIRDGGSMMPILMLTAKALPEDKHTGFLVGTDDYMTKPPDKTELLLRIKALLRRARIVDEHKITVGDVVVDMDSRTVRRGMEVQTLPPKEFELLYKLLAYPERTFTRMELLDEIWGIDSESDDKTVNVHINRLRNRFYDWPEFEIQTVRGLGYRAVKKV